ncbi:MAG TPA: PAS domain S-box protein [Stenomitos sp.]
MADINRFSLAVQLEVLSVLLENSPDASYVCDQAGRYLYANPAGLLTLGLDASDVLGKTGHELDLPADWLAQLAAKQEAVFQSKAPLKTEISFATAQGMRHCEDTFLPMPDPGEAIHAVLHISRDITAAAAKEQELHNLNATLEAKLQQKAQEVEELKAALQLEVIARQTLEQRLEEHEQQCRALLGSIFEGMIIQADEQIIETNVGFARLFGYEVEEVLGKAVVDFFTPESYEVILKHIETQSELSYEAIGIKKDGSLIHIEGGGQQCIYQGRAVQVFAIRDISERKFSEWALQESEAQFAATFQSSPDAIVITRASDGKIINTNPQFTHVTGYRHSEAIGQSTVGLQLWANPEERDQITALLETELTIQNHEATFRKKSGETFTGLLSCQLVEIGGQLCILSVVKDISDRIEAEIALRKSEERLRLALGAARMGNWDWHIDTNQIIWSESLQELMGIEPGTFDGSIETLSAMIFPEDRQRVFAAIHRSIDQGDAYDIEFRFVRPDGTIRWACSKGNVFYDDSGTAVRMAGVDIDITERKQAEHALAKELLRVQTLFNTAFDGIVILNEAGQVLEANPRFAEMLGYTSAEVAELSVYDWDCQFTTEELQQNMQTVLSCKTRILETKHRRKDGSAFAVEVSSNIVEWEGEYIRFCSCRDISERKRVAAEREQSEAALRQREYLLNLFAQYAPAGIAMFDRQMQYVMASQRWVNDYHLDSVESLIGRSHDEVFSELPTRWHEVHQRCLAGTIEKCDEELLIRPDGTQQWIRWEAHPWHSATDVIGGVIIFSEDITQRKQAEHSLQELNQSLEQRIAERTTELRISEGRVRQQANRETLLREITQRIRESLNLQTIFDTACQEILHWSQAERVSILQFEPGTQLGGGHFVAEAVISGFPSILGLAICDHCFSQEHEPFYQQGRVQATSDIYNSPLNTCLSDLLTQFQIRAHLLVPLLQGNELWGLLCIDHCSAPHQWQTFEIQVAQEIANQLAIAIQQASLFAQVQHQLTERQQAQEQLSERNYQLALSNQELARATRLKDEFLANMSHELRTPLNAILGMSEGLQDEVFGEINVPQRNALQTIERTGQHLLSLINDILDLAKVESGQLELDCSPTSVSILCRASLDFIKQQAHKKEIKVELKLPSNLPPLSVDERRIKQVLINLLSNAVKFTANQGCVTLDVHPLNPPGTDQGTSSWLRFSIRDTGIGIAPEHLSKLFQPFIQVDSALNRQYEGTGLGLALVKRIVELHNGVVGVTSEVGIGSCFTIDLPYTIAQSSLPEPTAPMTSRHEPSSPDPTNSPLLLLVEDNEDNIMTISLYLEQQGYRLLIARNGQEAITLVQCQLPDLILMDIQMPGMDGLEAIQHIRRLPDLSRIPIIALTALAMIGDRERCLAAGANEYLSKPVKLKQLTALIQQFLQPKP